MSKKIIFQKCHLNNIYFLCYIIMDFINQFILYKFYPSDNEVGESYSNYILPTLLLSNIYIHNLSDFVAIIPFIISLILSKRKKNDSENMDNDDTKHNDEKPLIFNDKKKQVTKIKKNKIILYCIFIALLDFLQKFVSVLYSMIYPGKEFDIYPFSCYIPFEIILQFIVSYFILKIAFYKLQYFSLFLNLSIFVIILIIDIINIKNHNSFEPRLYFYYALTIVFYSVEYALIKKILLEGFLSIYLIMIFKGLFLLIVVSIFILIMFLIKHEPFPKFEFYFTHSKYIALIISKIFSNFLASLFLWLILDRFSPNYYPFVLIFNQFTYLILDKIDDKNYEIMGWDLYFRIFLYIISTIGVMIHNEIVVINICNLGSDTKYFLDLKLANEEIFNKAENPEIIKRYETFAEMGTLIKGDLISNDEDNSSID